MKRWQLPLRNIMRRNAGIQTTKGTGCRKQADWRTESADHFAETTDFGANFRIVGIQVRPWQNPHRRIGTGNDRLRSKIRSYETAIERNNLWHIFNPHRSKIRNWDDAR